MPGLIITNAFQQRVTLMSTDRSLRSRLRIGDTQINCLTAGSDRLSVRTSDASRTGTRAACRCRSGKCR